MQDNSTGLMHRVPAEAAQFDRAAMSDAMSKIIPKERQGGVFREGEIIELNGGKFRIQKIIKKGLVLHGVPA